MVKHYGRYTSKTAYEHAKAVRRLNAKKWRKNHKEQEKINWRRSNTRKFINGKNINEKDVAVLKNLVNQRCKKLNN